MTPALVDAIEKYSLQERLTGKATGLAEEPPLRDAAVGKPVSHHQVLAIFHTLQKRYSAEEGGGTDDDPSRGHGPALNRMIHLDDLLRGSRVYQPPPPPKPEPTDEYKVLMQRLRQQEEERVYERMLQRPSSRTEDAVHANMGKNDEDGEMTYADVNRQLTLIINVLVSIVACSFAIWMASGHWTAPARLALTMIGSVVVATAEVVVYHSYLGKMKTAREKGKRQVEVKEIIKTWVIDGQKNGEKAERWKYGRMRISTNPSPGLVAEIDRVGFDGQIHRLLDVAHPSAVAREGSKIMISMTPTPMEANSATDNVINVPPLAEHQTIHLKANDKDPRAVGGSISLKTVVIQAPNNLERRLHTVQRPSGSLDCEVAHWPPEAGQGPHLPTLNLKIPSPMFAAKLFPQIADLLVVNVYGCRERLNRTYRGKAWERIKGWEAAPGSTTNTMSESSRHLGRSFGSVQRVRRHK
ncbi:MAG: hypothetical protein M1826_006449 [Phylliscum demangeonii]|nr:MAG: hypothetical protein M1826_006449 [Phylliscum demangeonii]